MATFQVIVSQATHEAGGQGDRRHHAEGREAHLPRLLVVFVHVCALQCVCFASLFEVTRIRGPRAKDSDKKIVHVLPAGLQAGQGEGYRY